MIVSIHIKDFSKREDIKNSINFLYPHIDINIINKIINKIKKYDYIVINNNEIKHYTKKEYELLNDIDFLINDTIFLDSVKELIKYKLNSTVLVINNSSDLNILKNNLEIKNINYLEMNNCLIDSLYFLITDNIHQISNQSFWLIEKHIKRITIKEYLRFVKLKQLL